MTICFAQRARTSPYATHAILAACIAGAAVSVAACNAEPPRATESSENEATQTEGSVGSATVDRHVVDGTTAQDPELPGDGAQPPEEPVPINAGLLGDSSEPHPIVAENGPLERGCGQGDGQDCADLGNLLLEAEGDLWDGETAVGYFQQGCDLNNPHACNHLGWYRYMSGIGGDVDVRMAAQLFGVACEGDYMMACNNLGNLYLNAQGMEQDLDRARVLYMEACEGEVGYACTSLGLMALNGNGLPQDTRQALDYMRQGCENDDAAGCNDYAYYGFIEGQAGEVDYDAARVILEPACDDGAMMACNNLGNLYLHGNGVPQDHERAHSYYVPACQAGIGFACQTLNSMGY